MNTSILISGSTGMVGEAFISALALKGHTRIYRVRRKPSSLSGDFYLDISQPKNSDPLPDGELIWINLNGAGIADKPWSPHRKEVLIQSRVKTTHAIEQICTIQNRQLQTYIGASAVGVYGIKDMPNSFLQHICQLWEDSHLQVNALHRYILRIPIVLSSRGGALKKMNIPFRLGLGGPLGSGRQLFPWIHLHDLVGIVKEIALKEDHQLPVDSTQVNACHYITPYIEPLLSQGEFARTFAQVLKRPGFLSTPSLAIKLLFGHMGQEALLGNPDMQNEKAYPWNYQYNDLKSALEDITKNQS